MNISDIILQFARGAKNAQVVLNEKTGDDAADIPMVIKEAEFKYNLSVELSFENTTEVSARFFVKATNTTKVGSNSTEGLELRLLFENHMLVVNEANK